MVNGLNNKTDPSDRELFVVGVGASAGGIDALRKLFAQVNPNSGLAYVVILHLAPQYESNLAALIQASATIPVSQVTESIAIEPNHVYVIPPEHYLVIADRMVKLARPEHTGGHTSIDLFFRTLADGYGKDAFAVVLSGSGSDGAIGIRRVKERGGFVIAQSPEEAEYNGMPRAAIATGLVDFILPVADIPEKLCVLRDGGRLLREKEPEGPTDPEGAALRDILTLVRVRTGHDFTQYKRPTLLRRIGRRLQVHEVTSYAQYLETLHRQPDEINALLSDLLITVTNFFRDRDCFNYLEKEIVPGLFVDKSHTDVIRVWSVGCATGEEAYSLGILLLEHAQRVQEPPQIQVFATDIDEHALSEARHGVYPPNISLDVSPERLRQFFVAEGDHHRVTKDLREIVMFASHNVLRDPPFSKIDLVSCRNLLIYLNREMQERVLAILHFALRPDGILFLGSSESAETASSMFEPLDKKRHVYRRREILGDAQRWPNLDDKWQPRWRPGGATNEPRFLSLALLHQELIEQLGPPSVLIDNQYDILHVSANAGKFLRFAAGEPTRNLLKVISPDLHLDLRAALLSVKEHGPESRRVKVKLDGAQVTINLTVRPITHKGVAEGYFLVMFDETGESVSIGGTIDKNASASERREINLLGELEKELQRTKDELRSTVDQYETSTEELRASNEELQAINEELRSTTEELETSKEELQSVNEELTTVNQQYREKIEEVGHANSDLQNLLASTEIGNIFLDRTLKIKRYTPRAQQLFNITPADIGRPLEHFTHKLNYTRLPQDAEQVLKTLQSSEREVQAIDGSWHLVRLLPYRTVDDRTDGVVLTLVDITSRRKAEEELKREATRLRKYTEMLDLVPMLICDLEGRIRAWNSGSERLYGYMEAEVLGKNVDEVLKTEYPVPVAQVREQIITNGLWEGQLQRTTKAGNRVKIAHRSVLQSRESSEAIVIETDLQLAASARETAATPVPQKK